MGIKNFSEACTRIFEAIKSITGDVKVNTDGSLQDQISALITGTKTANKATKWSNARNINGMSVDGTANRTNYGTCSTAAATVAKVVACTGFALVTGAEITVKFTVTNTAANPTLNVNGTGAKPIYYRGSAINAGYLAANRTYTFRYNGSQYELVGDIDTKVTVDSALSGTSTNPVQNKVINAFLNAIIDGSKQVGLANSLVSDNTFAKGETIESWVLATNNFAIKFIVSANGYPSDAPIQNEGFCILLEHDTRRKIVLFIPYHIKSTIYIKDYFGKNTLVDWFKINSGVAETLSGLTATIAELNYCDGVTSNIQNQLDKKLSTTGGEMTGKLKVFPGGLGGGITSARALAKDGTTHEYWTDICPSVLVLDSMLTSTFNHSIDGVVLSHLLLNEKGVGFALEGQATKKLFGEHNKPTGTYTGNGSATERKINTGGIGDVVFLVGDGHGAIVTSQGAVIFVGAGTTLLKLSSTEIRFNVGIFTIASTNNAVNKSGVTYTYQVL